jgi:isoquinoline 1-oxidoreductase subunit beta
VSLSRRTFLTGGFAAAAAVGGGLVVWRYRDDDHAAVGRQVRADAAPTPEGLDDRVKDPSLWVRIARDGTVTVIVSKQEMGQNIVTGLATIVAEELDADWSNVKVGEASFHDAYLHPWFGRHITCASSSTVTMWSPLREAGALARAMLVEAAARRWHAPSAELRTESGHVVHRDGRRLGYGELADEAAALPVPTKVEVKDPSTFRLIGQARPRLDGPAKVSGTAPFAFDLVAPGMLVALIARPPWPGATIKHIDDSKAKAIRGVDRVVRLDNPISPGVAVLANGFWPANKAREALVIEWTGGTKPDTGAIEAALEASLAGQGTVLHERGDPTKVLARASKKLEATYRMPFLAHLPMEPMACLAHVTADRCEVSGGFQDLTHVRELATSITGLDESRVVVRPTFMGGSFGRRQFADYAAEAIELSKRVGRPVKVLWTRTDDIQHSLYHPATITRHEAAFDADGSIAAWRQRVAGHTIMDAVLAWGLGKQPGSDFELHPYVTGALHHECLPTIEGNDLATFRLKPFPTIRTWAYRAVGMLHNAVTRELFLDELCRSLGHDPLERRLALVQGNESAVSILQILRDKVWRTPLATGRTRGLAYVTGMAVAAEISMTGSLPRVHHLTCVLEIGTVIDPDSVRNQVEGCIAFGITAATKPAISIADGRVVQSNFHDAPVLRINEMPTSEIHYSPVGAPGSDPISISEGGVPAVIAAVANAVAAATGKPIRRLPLGTA